MNRYSAYARRIPGGFGYWAMLRFCRDAHPAPVMAEGDRPKVFATEAEATAECLKHVMAFINGRPIRGETFETVANDARSKAERLFVGGGRVVEVERLEAAR